VQGEVCVNIDLSRIETEPVSFDEELSLAGDRLDSAQLDGVISVHIVGSVRPAGVGFLVDGSFSAAGKLRCSRCLESVPWQVEEKFAVDYRRPESAPRESELALGGHELDVDFLVGETIDINEVAAEQVLLTLPMRIVCDEACAGLCPRCGANRNLEGGCRCEPEVDPRWEALQDLSGRDATN